MPDAAAPAGEMTPVDPAFTVPGRPAFYTLNIPLDEEIAALLADRERLKAFLTPGHALWRRASLRTWANLKHTDETGETDPSFGQKSNLLAREEHLASYQWFTMYGPTLLLLVDAALLEGQLEAAAKAEQPPPAVVPRCRLCGRQSEAAVPENSRLCEVCAAHST